MVKLSGGGPVAEKISLSRHLCDDLAIVYVSFDCAQLQRFLLVLPTESLLGRGHLGWVRLSGRSP